MRVIHVINIGTEFEGTLTPSTHTHTHTHTIFLVLRAEEIPTFQSSLEDPRENERSSQKGAKKNLFAKKNKSNSSIPCYNKQIS